MNIRPMEEKDIAQVRELVNHCRPLDLHTAFTYWILANYFNNTCLVMEDKCEIVGYTGGMKSSAKEGVFYLWQIGILPEYRGKGFFGLLLEKVMEAAKKSGCKILQFSVLPDNWQSLGAFSSFSKKKGIPMIKTGSIEFYDSLENEEFEEDIYEIPL